MFCSSCGRELPENVSFCSYCGGKIEQPPKIAVTQASNSVLKQDVKVLREYLGYAKKLEVDKYTLQMTVNKISEKKNRLGKSTSIYKERLDFRWTYIENFAITFIITIIALIFFGVISYNVDGDYFGLFSVETHFCIVFASSVLGGAIGVIRKRKKIEDEYSSEIYKDRKRVEEEKRQILVLENQEKQLLERMNKVNELLANLYSLDVIYPKYRELVPVITMLEYIESGRCVELTGRDGAYNIYESEIRQNVIISSLGRVISMLGSIRDNQYALYQAIQSSNALVENMSMEIEKLAVSNERIAANSKLSAFYSQVVADNTKASAYIDSCNFRGIKYM